MKWAHIDEAYTWQTCSTSFAKRLRQSYPEHFAAIPKELYERLEKAWKELDTVTQEVAKYRGKEPS